MKKIILPIIIAFLFVGCKKKESITCPDFSVVGTWTPTGEIIKVKNQTIPPLSLSFLLDKPETTVLKFTTEYYNDIGNRKYSKLYLYDNSEGKMVLKKTLGYYHSNYNRETNEMPMFLIYYNNVSYDFYANYGGKINGDTHDNNGCYIYNSKGLSPLRDIEGNTCTVLYDYKIE